MPLLDKAKEQVSAPASSKAPQVPLSAPLAPQRNLKPQEKNRLSLHRDKA